MTSKHPEPSSWPSDGKRPSPAARARTAVAAATIARLTTYSRRAPVRSVVTGVDVEGEDRGRPVVLVPAGSLAAVQLLARPLASLQIAPPGHEPTTVHGGVRRLPGTDEGRLRYRVEVGAVRVGHGEPVPVESYLAAEPDPAPTLPPSFRRFCRRDRALPRHPALCS